VLVLTGVTERTRLAETLEAGAIGVVPKSLAFDELVEVVERVLVGEPAMRAGEGEALLAELREARTANQARLAPFAALTDREAGVLASLMGGKTAEQVAAESFVSVSTVRTQIRGVLRKLGVNSQLQSVALARELGWVPPFEG
jgi:DNA-binding NarL/FixJ family response regulator